MSDSDKIEAVFAEHGWEVSNFFLSRYQTDAWVYNLTNALVTAHEENERLRGIIVKAYYATPDEAAIDILGEAVRDD